MGLFNIFKKEFWKESKNIVDENERKNSESQNKTTFLVGYKLVFKDTSDKNFENKPCYKTNFSDGSENDCSLCRKIMELDRIYSRAEIEQLTQRLGYSVFDRVARAIDENGHPNCACKWESTVVITK